MRERSNRDRVPYEQWQNAGAIEATPGNVIDYDRVAARLRWALDTYNVQEIAFDPWNATQFIQPFVDAGIVCVEMRQGYASLSAPTKRLLSLVLEGKLQHGGHPVLRWNADNAMTKSDDNENVRLVKPAAGKRIDCLAALVTALARLGDDQSGSVYEERELLVL